MLIFLMIRKSLDFKSVDVILKSNVEYKKKTIILINILIY